MYVAYFSTLFFLRFFSLPSSPVLFDFFAALADFLAAGFLPAGALPAGFFAAAAGVLAGVLAATEPCEGAGASFLTKIQISQRAGPRQVTG